MYFSDVFVDIIVVLYCVIVCLNVLRCGVLYPLNACKCAEVWGFIPFKCAGSLWS
jgi:hypothetical protein